MKIQRKLADLDPIPPPLEKETKKIKGNDLQFAQHSAYFMIFNPSKAWNVGLQENSIVTKGGGGGGEATKGWLAAALIEVLDSADGNLRCEAD